MQDPISNLIIKIKNASARGIATISFPYSKLAFAVAELLQKEGYVGEITKKGKKVVKTMDIELAYGEDKTPKVTDVQRVSKLSKRVYAGSKDLKAVRSGYGLLVLTTPLGVISDKEAKKAKVGGEVLFKIW
jgi:small subunit ribosomal protein S8